MPRASSVSARPVVAGIAIGLLLLVAWTYRRLPEGAFVHDDHAGIVDNPTLAGGPFSFAAWRPPVDGGTGGRPLANATLALSHRLGGGQPAAFLVGNGLLHAAAALLLFAVLRRTFSLPGSPPRLAAAAAPAAGLAAAVWAVHPLGSAAVAYASQRTEILMAVCALTAGWALLRAADEPGRRRWPWLAAAACAAGMAAKETMATVPLLLAVFDRIFLAGTWREVWARRARLHLACAATWILLAALMLESEVAQRGIGPGRGVAVADYALGSVHTLARYAGLAVWPSPLVFDYGWFTVRPADAVWPCAGLAAGLAALAFAARRWPRFVFAPAAGLVLLLPTTSLIPVVHQPVAESRVYLPLAFAAAAAVAVAIEHARRAGRILLGSAVVAGSASTARRTADYRDPVVLWRDTVAKRPANARAHGNLAAVLLGSGRPDAAVAAADQALRLRPAYPDAWHNRGAALAALGRWPEAMAAYRTALALEADRADTAAALGQAMLRQGEPTAAEAELRRAVRLDPALAAPHNDLAVLCLQLGRPAESAEFARRAARLDPRLAAAPFNLGNALLQLGEPQAALAAFDDALRLGPDFAPAVHNRGVALLRLGRPAEAANAFARTLELDPAHPRAPVHLATARAAVENGRP